MSPEVENARETQRLVEEKGRACLLLLSGDLADAGFCRSLVRDGVHTVKAALPHMHAGSSFTRALSNAVVERGIRVNAVAPGPIRTSGEFPQ